ncbi:ankyrin repeat and protein kinase domain-containing protein 1-like [Schistocerca americana]|uniref:ankyrin repeat and protein kinase domain-containing protein 1-like n=1 Tax=Schistocerca americana TaxID=7009 RepID=UPI001F4FE8EC|nr:ankyrin repeat and protein kinase domain-containing protein 1-like [Schistocerca americana]XP_046983839.1 ankyrin repeat and protein kinase domain-containing protein 1-like [Schistocerca americana]
MAAVKEVQQNPALDLGALLDAGDGAVVMLVAGETRLAAHRAVLVARSPVFAAMFQHDTLEASSGHISITDVEGPVMRQLLAYLYTLQVPQLPTMALQMMVAADKYGLSALRSACEQQVSAQLTIDNVAAAAVLAVRHSCPDLTLAAVDFIKTHFVHVVGTQGWADAVLNQPKDVVEVSRLLSEPPLEMSVTATTESEPTTSTQPHSDQGQTPITAVFHTAPHQNLPLDDTTVSLMRHLPEEEKGRRLIQAAKEGAVQTLRSLLAAGADVRATDKDSNTALHWAAAMGNTEVVRCLVEGGAEVGARNDWQNTPLHSAAKNDCADVVRLLVASAADPNAKHEAGWTPLHWAAAGDHQEAAVALLEAGADKGARDDSGATPRHLARQNNHHQLAQLLN